MEALDPCLPGGSTEVPTHLCICEPPGNSWECVEPKTLGVFLCLLKKVHFKDMGVNLVGLVLCRVRSQLCWVWCPCSILSSQRAPRLRTTWKHWQPFFAATATWEHLLLVCCCSRSGVNFLEEKKKKKGNNASPSLSKSTQLSTTFYVAMKCPSTLPLVMWQHVTGSTAFFSPALSSRHQTWLAKDQKHSPSHTKCSG